MLVIPSIDISGGKSVRLRQGDFEQISYYDILPEEIALNYSIKGVKALHLVDLDGAKNGEITQLETIKKIRYNFKGIIQVGGGIRTQEQVENLFAIGIDRVVIGSLALKDINKTKEFFKLYGNEKIVLALDFKMQNDVPFVATRGWQDMSNVSVDDLIETYKDLKYILSTDISKDGMQVGTNIDFYTYLTAKYKNICVEASGGISKIEEVKKLKQNGVYGAIIGKALFENKISLDELLNI